MTRNNGLVKVSNQETQCKSKVHSVFHWQIELNAMQNKPMIIGSREVPQNLTFIADLTDADKFITNRMRQKYFYYDILLFNWCKKNA